METGEIFDSIIVDEQVAISDMPQVQTTSLIANIKYSISKYKEETRENIIDIALIEIEDAAIMNRIMPSKKELLSAKNIRHLTGILLIILLNTTLNLTRCLLK